MVPIAFLAPPADIPTTMRRCQDIGAPLSTLSPYCVQLDQIGLNQFIVFVIQQYHIHPVKMASWDSIIRFEGSDGKEHWAALPLDATPTTGAKVLGFPTVDALEQGSGGNEVTVQKVRFNRALTKHED